jgi:predicted dithiol-disulfide oxidoreductase (DUF899 family)
MPDHRVVSRDAWREARLALLAREEEAFRLRDEIVAQRMALPWVRVEEPYVFDTIRGPRTLAELFDGRSQLIVYHFMFDPAWQAGCPGCSFLADHLDGALPHLENHDVSLVVISRAPLASLMAYKARMGWRFPWVSSGANSFNYDFGVSFTPDQIASGKVVYNFADSPVTPDDPLDLPGLSVFFKDEEGRVFHTYSGYGREPQELVGALMILDHMPKGRNETTEQDFVRRHDEYDEPAGSACCAQRAAV